jgi:hypothetical protein
LALLPLEISFGVIEKLSAMMVRPLAGAKVKEIKTLNYFTDPLCQEIVHVS